MYCKYCGNKLSDGAILCPQCGRLFEDALSGLPAAPQAKPASSEPANKINPLGIAGFAIALSASLLAVLMLFFVNGESKLPVTMFWLCSLAVLCAMVVSIIALALAGKRRMKKGFAIAGLVISAAYLVGLIVLVILGYLAIYALVLFFSVLLLGAGA